MCAIIGSFNSARTAERIFNALKVLKNRGIDGFGIATNNQTVYNNLKIDIGDNAIAHRLHSIVGHVSQPLVYHNIKFVANCEIYNWKELNIRHNLHAKNDADLLFKLVKDIKPNRLSKVLDQVNGVYAFALWRGNELVLARDILGIKPLWYALGDGFEFASERKVLENLKSHELNPRQILCYNTKTQKLRLYRRRFFKTGSVNESIDKIEQNLISLIVNAVKKRLTDKKVGLLFSGGIDSVVIALILKRLGVDFCCYTAAVHENCSDVIFAKEAAKNLGLKLKVKIVNVDKVEDYLKKVVALIEDTNVPKVGVALTLYAACEMAKQDKVKVIFSGMGSDDIFAGYHRHKSATNLNNECLSSLRKLYERDTYRDDVVTMDNNLELRVPYLDLSVVKYALSLPSNLKIKDGVEKWILRRLALRLGLDKKFAYRKKKAAQYASGFDHAIKKLAKGYSTKSEYLQTFYKKKNFNLAVLCSSGKDSLYAMYVMQKQNYSIKCLITIKSSNPASFMYHTPNIHMAELQAKAMGLPIILRTTKGKKEEELNDLELALKEAIRRYDIQGVVVGAIFSQYQRDRVEKICDKLGLYLFAPLWHKDQNILLEEMLKERFRIIVTKIAAWGLDKTWLGEVITKRTLNKLSVLNKKYGINVAGEGGEYETLVLNAPMFRKRIKLLQYEVKMENDYTGEILIKRAKLQA